MEGAFGHFYNEFVDGDWYFFLFEEQIDETLVAMLEGGFSSMIVQLFFYLFSDSLLFGEVEFEVVDYLDVVIVKFAFGTKVVEFHFDLEVIENRTDLF